MNEFKIYGIFILTCDSSEYLGPTKFMKTNI